MHMKYVKVASVHEMNAGDKKKIILEGKAVLLVNIQNTYYAVDNTCTHLGGSLAEGRLDGKHIVCPRHGSVFDVTNGQVVEPGKLLLLKVKVRDLHSYPVRIDGEDVLLGIEGEADDHR
jgi:3-phenylpropionate/trans-cinnamate dioxygenase ferredoxin component